MYLLLAAKLGIKGFPDNTGTEGLWRDAEAWHHVAKIEVPNESPQEVIGEVTAYYRNYSSILEDESVGGVCGGEEKGGKGL